MKASLIRPLVVASAFAAFAFLAVGQSRAQSSSGGSGGGGGCCGSSDVPNANNNNNAGNCAPGLTLVNNVCTKTQ